MKNLVLYNLKRMFLDKRLLIGVFIIPLIIISIGCFSMSPNNNITKTNLAFLDLARNDDSSYLLKSLSSKYFLKEKSETELLESIKTNKSRFGIVINYSDPYVTIYKGSNSDDSMLKNDINLYINSKGLTPLLNINEKNLQSSNPYTIIISLIINFCLFSSIYVAQEMHNLKEKKLLRRLFSTQNSQREVISSILICFFVILSFQFLLFNVVAYLITKTLLIPSIIGGIALFLSYVFITISLGLIVSRICESTSSVPAIVNAIVIPLGVISGTFMPRSFLPDIVQKVSFLAPQYWFYNGVEKLAENNLLLILPNICVLILISIALFLVGTLKTVKFVE